MAVANASVPSVCVPSVSVLKRQATLLWQTPCKCVPYRRTEGQMAHWEVNCGVPNTVGKYKCGSVVLCSRKRSLGSS